MSVFRRFSDIINSNISAMLDKAENPEKMVKLIISEMENTLFEARRECAKVIAEQKEMLRQLTNMQQEAQLWQQRAEKALLKERDDLAKQALAEKNRIEQAINAQQKELSALDSALLRLEQEISQLQAKLNEAVARKKALLARHQTVNSTIKMRQQFEHSAIDEALERFENFERKMDQLEAQVEAMDFGRNQSLSEQIDSLEKEDALDKELAALKQKMQSKNIQTDTPTTEKVD
ncbi:phage shock protein PspA [Aliikangiella maris]|uniref:Phage shock protein PspA n=2 Tax=Aliikangiella maris TaxID=3162458 RepID=A0ABV2BT72_9GAMM